MSASSQRFLAAARRTLDVGGVRLTFAQHFFDVPVAQPRRLPRRADLTGLKVWPTAIRLLERLERDELPQLRARALADGRPLLRVLELGSGTGVLGLGVAALGGASVTVTDPNLEVNFSEFSSGSSLAWLQANVDANRVAIEAVGSAAEARELEWSTASHAAALRAACLPLPGDAFDLVLGSELLYDADHYGALVGVLRDFCAPGRTTALLGFTHRHDGEKRFLRAASAHFEVEVERFAGSAGTPTWEIATLRARAEPCDGAPDEELSSA